MGVFKVSICVVLVDLMSIHYGIVAPGFMSVIFQQN